MLLAMPSSHLPEIAVLGAGSTAAAIVRRLVRAGFRVWVWDPVPARADALAPYGAWVAKSPAAAAGDAAVVITRLANADFTAEAMIGFEGAAPQMRSGSLWLQMTDVPDKWSDGFSALAAKHRLEYVDAELAGDDGAAERGGLIVLAHGPESLRERSQAVLDAIARHTRWFDTDRGFGHNPLVSKAS
jgi:3-hydroxyisobutyrate dehydrogenase